MHTLFNYIFERKSPSFYLYLCSSFAFCFFFLSFAFPFDILFCKPSSFVHLYKPIYLFGESAFALRCTNRNLYLWAGQKHHTDGPVMFTGLFCIVFSLGTKFFTFAMNFGPYNFAYSTLQLNEFQMFGYDMDLSINDSYCNIKLKLALQFFYNLHWKKVIIVLLNNPYTLCQV